MQVYTHMLGLCHRGIQKAWPVKGYVSYGKTSSKMPPLGWEWLRSGPLKVEPVHNHLRILCPSGEFQDLILRNIGNP